MPQVRVEVVRRAYSDDDGLERTARKTVEVDGYLFGSGGRESQCTEQFFHDIGSTKAKGQGKEEPPALSTMFSKTRSPRFSR